VTDVRGEMTENGCDVPGYGVALAKAASPRMKMAVLANMTKGLASVKITKAAGRRGHRA